MTSDVDLEGVFIAANHQRTGHAVAAALLGERGMPDGGRIDVRRTHVSVHRVAGHLEVTVGGATENVTATGGSEDTVDMLAHSRSELLRGARRMRHRGAASLSL